MVVYGLLFFLLSSHCSCFVVHQTSSIIGQECDPPRGFARRICGRQTTLGTRSAAIPDFLYGPNVCRITEEFVSNVVTYRFKNHCGHVLHNYGYYYHQCIPFCKPTGVCSSRNRTLQRHNVECCPGFTTRSNFGDQLSQYYEHLYDTFYDRASEDVPLGCPVAKGDNVTQCINLLGLTAFGDLYESSGLEDNDEMGLTFFVPTNEALASLAPGMNSTVFVGNHIINGTVKLEDLTFNGRFTTLSGGQLRSTAVVFADPSLAQYSAGVHYLRGKSQDLSVRHTNVQFLNGARVVNPDACMSTGITLHVIDRLLMPGQSTLADILRSREEFSIFVNILETAGIMKFLDTEESRTVFAFTNDTFFENISPDLFECLMYNRLPLQNIALFHILGSTQYSSSLAIQPGVHTRLPNNPIYLSVPEEGEEITLFSTSSNSANSRAMIVDADISASNGVLHTINGVLFPPNLNLGMCAALLTTSVVMPSSTLPPDVMTTLPIESTTTLPIESTMTLTIEATPTPVINNAGIGNIMNNP